MTGYITVLIPDDTEFGSLRAIADDLGCAIFLRDDGTYVFEPRRQPRDYAPEDE